MKDEKNDWMPDEQKTNTHWKTCFVLPMPDFYDLKSNLEGNESDLTKRRTEYVRVLHNFNLNATLLDKDDPTELGLIDDWNIGKQCQMEIDFIDLQLKQNPIRSGTRFDIDKIEYLIAEIHEIANDEIFKIGKTAFRNAIGNADLSEMKIIGDQKRVVRLLWLLSKEMPNEWMATILSSRKWNWNAENANKAGRFDDDETMIDLTDILKKHKDA